jgi:hypothetical protein
VLFINLHIRRELTPLSARASEDMTKLDVLGIQEGWLIERARRHCANTWDCLQREPEVRTAAWTEVDLQPSARLVRNVTVSRRGNAGERNVPLGKHDLGPERRSGTALTPKAVADRDAVRFSGADIADRTTYTSTGVLSLHRAV